MKRRFIIHPFLFAILPIFTLFSISIQMATIAEVFLPLLLAIPAAAFFFAAFSFGLRDWEKGGCITSLCIVLFSFYLPLVALLRKLHFSLFGIAFEIVGLAVMAAIVCLVIYFLLKPRENLRPLTLCLNVFALIAVSWPLISTGAHLVKLSFSPTVSVDALEGSETLTSTERSALPNIYYIVLDGYAREDVLAELYEYDNHDFLEELRSRGFSLNSRSRGNYAQTALSLGSSLNFEHIEELVPVDLRYSRQPLRDLIYRNRVVKTLKSYGYVAASFESGYHFSAVRTDTYLARHKWRTGFENDFSYTLIGVTPVPFLLQTFGLPGLEDAHRQRTLFTFERLPAVTDLDAPVFVFAHVLSPHPPFLFGSDGEERNPGRFFSYMDGSHFFKQDGATKEQYITGYRDQLAFINVKVLEAIDRILSRKGSRPNVIILQSDHGPGLRLDWDDMTKTYQKERMSILNAYHLPEGGDALLYEGITPVNTFRVVFNHYLGTKLGLLEDASYLSTWDQPYELIRLESP